VTSNLRDLPRQRRRDPSGKAALFSHGAPPIEPEEFDRDPQPLPQPEPPNVAKRRPGTLVVECSACDARSRVTYFDFALLNLPVGVWLPLPGLHFNHRMTCPTCGQWTWLRAKWLE
jgi:hypothetical protein